MCGKYNNFKHFKIYITENNTYHVNGYTYGIYQDVLELLETQLNFSTTLYKREKEAWGMIYPQPNGSFIGTGIIGDIFFKRADLAVAPLGNVIGRARYVDYLPSLKYYYIDLFISRASGEYAIDLHLLLSPFAQDSWMLIISTAIIMALVKLGLLNIFGEILILYYRIGTFSLQKFCG